MSGVSSSAGARSGIDAHRNLLSAIVSRAIADINMRADSNEALAAASWILDDESPPSRPFSFVWLMDNLGYRRGTYEKIYTRARIAVREYYE